MACKFCRTNHHKCDDNYPDCDRCRRAGNNCVRPTPFRFKDSKSSSALPARSNHYVTIPPRVEFVDESESIARDYNGALFCTPEKSISPTNLGERTPPRTPPANWGGDASGGCVTSLVLTNARGLRWPVKSAEHAQLIQHFTTNVSRFFDFFDSRRHFARFVLQRSRDHDILANAVLALSARHLSRMNPGFYSNVADFHHNRCIEELGLLIGKLVNEPGIIDDELLAATVILRLLEEIDVSTYGIGAQTHLNATWRMLQAHFDMQAIHGRPSIPSSFCHAALWSAYRQDVYMALTEGRPMELYTLGPGIWEERAFEASDHPDVSDTRYANRAVLQCGDALQYAFVKQKPRDAHKHSELLSQNKHWKDGQPESFDAFFSDERTEQLPTLKYVADWHVMGHMYNCLALCILLINHPDSTRTNEINKEINLERGVEVKRTVATMAGIALSNKQTPAAMLVASMAIAHCAHQFDRRQEQEQLYRILQDTEREHGWPTGKAQKDLRESWRWDS